MYRRIAAISTIAALRATSRKSASISLHLRLASGALGS
jgi:hypothetical protein